MSFTQKKSPRSTFDLSHKMSTTQLKADVVAFVCSLIPATDKKEV